MAKLITRDFLKDQIPITESLQPKIDLLIDWIVEKAESIIGRKLSSETRTIYLTGFGDDTIILPVIPVTSITSISLDAERLFTETLDSDDYHCDYDKGIITLFSNITPEGVKTIKVVFTAGYDSETLPADLKFAFLEGISWNLKRINDSSFGVRNMTTPDGVNIGYELVLPLGVQRTFECYKDVRV